jgi:anti-anti-sigma factor
MLPKSILSRLTSKMISMNEMSNCMLCDESVVREEESRGEESREESMKLNLETRKTGDDVTIVSCNGRIVYRNEAAALSQAVSRLMKDACNLVLDLSGVEAMDGAGLGELVSLHNSAASRRCSLKLAALTHHVGSLFELTKLALVFEIYPTVALAVGSLEESAVS